MGGIEFSPERPFGVYLYGYFANAYKLVIGSNPDEFEFVVGETPLSTLNEVIVGGITYLAVLYGGQVLMANRPEIKAKVVVQVHNLVLSVLSLVLLLLFVEHLTPVVYYHGLFYSVCDEGAWRQRLVMLFYVNYLVKWWELLDTVFLVLRKKSLEFLHVYHHAMTAFLCYSQIVGKTPVSYIPVTLNLAVHVLMYYYYFRVAGGARIWWKQHVTTIQVAQFIIDLAFVYTCSYTYFAATYWPWLPNMGTCAGSETAAVIGSFTLSSYLFLFIDFYGRTYNRKRKPEPKPESSVTITRGGSEANSKAAT